MTLRLYIRIARWLHWLLSGLIVASIVVGLYGSYQPDGAGEPAIWMARIYALHKTLGMGALVMAQALIGWLLVPPSCRTPPAPHWPAILWRLSFWGLAAGMLFLPLSGPALHPNGPDWGYAAPFWPLPARVPGIPDSLTSIPGIAALHRQGWWLFAALVTLHTAMYFRKRRDRRRGISRTGSFTFAQGATLFRVAPWCGIALWAAFLGGLM